MILPVHYGEIFRKVIKSKIFMVLCDMEKFPDIFSRDFDRWETPKPTQRDRELFYAAKSQAASIPFESRNKLHFRFDRSRTGEELASALKESLVQHGIDPVNVAVRYFSKNRLSHALQTGSDRDGQSNVGYNGSTDGEQEWMRGLGIFANDQVTFVGPIGNRLTGGADAPKSHDNVYVIFDKRFLYKVGQASNGFHAFLTSPNRACIGFMSDQGTLELAQVSRPSTSPQQAMRSDRDPA